MSLNWSLRWIAVAGFALASAPSALVARPGAFGGGYGPPQAVVPPPKAFTTSDEHYRSLLEQAHGGCDGSAKAIERWTLWLAAGHTSSADAQKAK